jgi:hypothetical protein
MLGHLIFALKMLAVTIVVVFVMQIRVGSGTLEDRAYLMVHSSGLTHFLEKVAQGGIHLWNDGVAKISGPAHHAGPHTRGEGQHK